MNALVSFRLCTLSDEELLIRIDRLTDEMFQKGKVPSCHIPAQPNNDYDLLIGELIVRYNNHLISGAIGGTPGEKELVCEAYNSEAEKIDNPQRNGVLPCVLSVFYTDGIDHSDLEGNSNQFPEHEECVYCASHSVTITDDKDICHDCGYVYE